MQDVDLQDSAAFDAAVTRLEGLRLTAMEDRFDAEISLGHGAELVTELTDLVAAHPLRERLVAALMRALVAAGRDAEALLVYQRTREALADALGVDPSPELSALHVALLRGELGRRAGKPEDQRARRADQLRRQGRRCRRGPRTHRRAPAHHPDRAGRLGEDQAGHGNRAHAARRPAGRGLAGGARHHRRGSGTWRRRRSTGLGLRDALLGDGAERGPDGPAHRGDPRAGCAADPGQLRARDRVGGGVRLPGARGVPAAADPGHEQGTARHHR